MASDREKERQERHSIFYHESTSEIKNDIGALLDCWKGPGLSNKSSFPLGRTEAGFLLWYHALNNQDSLQEMFDNGAIGTSILVLDQQSSELGAVTDTERTVASSLLRLLVDNEDFRDKFLSAKGQAGSGFEVLSESLSNILVGQERVAGILRVLAEGAKHRGRIITNFSPLPWKEYVNVLADRRNKNQAAKTELAFFIRYVTMGSDELKEEAGEAGIISGLLEMLRTCKSESALNAAAGCLYRLTEADLVLDRLAEEGGIKLLADLISAPPKLYIKAASLEKKRRAEEAARNDREVQEKREDLRRMKELQETSRLQKETTKSHQDPDTQGVPSGPKGIRAGKGLQGTSLPNIIGRSPAVAQNKFKGSQNLSSRASAEIPTPSSTTERLDFTMPRIDTKYIPVNHSGTPFTIGSTYPPHQVGTSSLRVQWSRKLGIQTRSYASAVLYALSQKDDHCPTLESCAVVYRLCCFLSGILEQAEPAKGGKGKDKGKGKKGKPAKLKLGPEEENAVVAITGCIRHLTATFDTNKARVVKYGVVPMLVQVYEQSTRNKARWNCRAILNDVGWIHENGAALNASGNFPEEFLVYDPMHLRKADMNLLQKEFEAEDDPSDPQSRGVSTYKSLRVDVGAA